MVSEGVNGLADNRVKKDTTGEFVVLGESEKGGKVVNFYGKGELGLGRS